MCEKRADPNVAPELAVSLGLVSFLPDSPNQLLLPKSLATSFAQQEGGCVIFAE